MDTNNIEELTSLKRKMSKMNYMHRWNKWLDGGVPTKLTKYCESLMYYSKIRLKLNYLKNNKTLPKNNKTDKIIKTFDSWAVTTYGLECLYGVLGGCSIYCFDNKDINFSDTSSGTLYHVRTHHDGISGFHYDFARALVCLNQLNTDSFLCSGVMNSL